MIREGRMLDVEKSHDSGNFSLPNFRTKIPLPVVARGYVEALGALYGPEGYYDRAFESLVRWKVKPCQRPPELSLSVVATILRSIWYQGIRSTYRRQYWEFCWRLLRHWGLN